MCGYRVFPIKKQIPTTEFNRSNKQTASTLHAVQQTLDTPRSRLQSQREGDARPYVTEKAP